MVKSGRTTRTARKSFDSFSSRFEDSFLSFGLFCLKGGLDRGEWWNLYAKSVRNFISFFHGEAKEKGGENDRREREREKGGKGANSQRRSVEKG